MRSDEIKLFCDDKESASLTNGLRLLRCLMIFILICGFTFMDLP
ncbi:hypothetical protein [Anaerofustis sp.]|nr:hypothetical protein [Anaerofustis sp.]